MEKNTLNHFIRNEKEEKLAARIDKLAEKCTERAEQHDREGSFPFDNFEDLKQAGYLKLTVPKEFGGDEISLYELVMAQERLARGDGSTALAVGWHMGLVYNLRSSDAWPESVFEQFCKDVVRDGAMINSFASEPATGSPSRGGKPETTAVPTEGGYRITGRKTFSTMSPILDRFIVTAGIEGEDRVGEFLVYKTKEVSVDETWDTLGMRATGSHDIVLDGVFVPEQNLLDERETGGRKKKRGGGGNGWMLHIPACYSGIALAARDFAVDFAKTYKPNSLPGPIADLPNVQTHIGNIESKLMTARTVLYAVAERWDRDEEGRAQIGPELAHAKTVVTNTALEIVDIAMRITGGASLSKKLPLERLYRDVRAGLHNPPMDDIVIKMLAGRALKE